MNKHPSPEGQTAVITGERATPLVARTLSRQARLSNTLAMGLMLLLGAATLAWYYERQFARQSQVRHSRQLAANAAVGAEMALPPLGELFSPQPAIRAPAQPQTPSPSPTPPAPGLTVPGAMTADAVAQALSPAPLAASDPPRVGAAGAARATAHADRRLQGEVYQGSAPDVPAAAAAGPAPLAAASPALAAAAVVAAPAPAAPGELAAPDSVPIVARRLRGRSLLLSKGTFIDCTLETAIDSTLPGITSCVTATDIFSADGRVVLLERGTRLFGETQGQVQQGSARVYVLWTEARTPAGVVVPLQSPGTDELGRSGLPGKVQRHFWQRFGAGLLLSTIDGAIQAAVQASSRNGGTVIYNPGATQDVMTEVLKSTIAIAPTVIKRNGDRIEVLVARDVDFSTVYQLRATQAGE